MKRSVVHEEGKGGSEGDLHLHVQEKTNDDLYTSYRSRVYQATGSP